MRVYGDDKFKNQLQTLDEEEKSLKNYLERNAGSISEIEAQQIKNILAGIKLEKEEVNELIMGTFY